MADRQLSGSARVAIVGGGPAGAAAALTLRRYVPDVRVVLVSAPAPAAPAVGETVSPGVLPLLEYLGIREAFLRDGHLPAGGTASAWGSERVVERSFLFTGRGLGWHVDRSRFDAWLTALVAAAGTRVVEGHAVASRDEAWTVAVAGGEKFTADVVVDATGRPARVMRRVGEPPRRDDALVAEARWYAAGHEEAIARGALVEAVADGWWYSAALPGGRGVAMFMTDRDLRAGATWDDRLESAPATSRRLDKWSPSGETAVRPAHSQRGTAVAGCVAAGDAACAFDPISALGIGFALRSGMEAARVAVAAAEGDTAPAAAYAASIARIYDDYRVRLRATYRAEGRWPDAPFWSRRINSPVGAGHGRENFLRSQEPQT